MPHAAAPADDAHPHPVVLPPTHTEHLLSLLLWAGGAGGKLDRSPTPRRGDNGDHGGHSFLLQAVQQVQVNTMVVGEGGGGEGKHQHTPGAEIIKLSSELNVSL